MGTHLAGGLEAHTENVLILTGSVSLDLEGEERSGLWGRL